MDKEQFDLEIFRAAVIIHASPRLGNGTFEDSIDDAERYARIFGLKVDERPVAELRSAGSGLEIVGKGPPRNIHSHCSCVAGPNATINGTV